MTRECCRHVFIRCLCALCAALIFFLWPFSATAQYVTPCGTPFEKEVNPGYAYLVLTEAAAELVDRDNIFAGGLTMGIASLDSLNSRLGVTRVRAWRPGPAIVFQVYGLSFGPDMTIEQTCSLSSLYQADPNVLDVWMTTRTYLVSTVSPSAWGAIKHFLLGGE
jgi:hypothetical protein